MRWQILAVVATLWACGRPVAMHPERPTADRSFSDIYERVMVKGTPIIVLSDYSQSDIHLEVRYTIGADKDPEGKAGLAHVVEHLLFEVPISDADDALSYGSALSRLSISWNAFTTIDTTSYLTILPKKNLLSVLNLEVMRAQRGCRGLSEKTFLREREVVRNEARERDLGGPSLQQALTDFIYPEGHPYRNSVIGSDASLTSIGRQDACNFMAQHYRPENRIIVVSGPVSRHDVASAADLVMSQPQTTTTKPVSLPDLSLASSADQSLRLDVETPLVLMTWPMAPQGSRQHRLQRQIVNGLMLTLDELAEKEKWVRSSGAAMFGGPRAPVMVALVALASSSDMQRAEELIATARAKTIEKNGKYAHGFLLQRQLLLQFEQQSLRTGLFAEYSQYGEPGFSLMQDFKELEATTEEEIAREAARALAQPGRTLRVFPEQSTYVRKETNVGIEADPPRQESFLEPDASTLRAANSDLPLPPHVGAHQWFRRYRLGSGMNLLFWHNRDLPLVHGRLIVPVGSSHAKPGYEGVSNVLPGSDDYDVTVFSQSAMSENADLMMYVLAASFRNSKRLVSAEDMGELKKSMERPESVVAQRYQKAMAAAIYGVDHRYTRVHFTRSSLDNLTKKAVADWAEKHRSVRGATLVVSGRFDPDLMHRLALYHFDRDARHELPAPAPAPNLPMQAAVVEGAQEEEASLGISVAFRGTQGIDQLQPARDILALIISNRLRRLREEQALTYGMQARYAPERSHGLWWISGSVDPRRSEEAMQSVLQVIAELRASPKGYIAEFANARAIMMARFDVSKPSAADGAARMTYLTRYALEDDYYEHYVRALARVKPAALQQLLDVEFADDNRVIGLYGPAVAIAGARKAIAEFTYTPAPQPQPATPKPDPAAEPKADPKPDPATAPAPKPTMKWRWGQGQNLDAMILSH